MNTFTRYLASLWSRPRQSPITCGPYVRIYDPLAYTKGSKSAPKPMTVSQEGIQARAIQMLIARSSITAWDILMLGTTDAHKMLTRMRRIGLLFPADDPRGYRWQNNRSGQGRHKVHYWTRKLPDSWVKPKVEQRTKARGGCR